MSDSKLIELIEPSVLQEIQDGFSKVTGLAAIMVDTAGAPLTQGSAFTDFCMKYIRQSEKGCKLCENCDRHGGEETARTGKASAYVCHAGLMDFAAPIYEDGVTVGSFIGGQALIGPPDDEHFRQIAIDLDINPDELVEAVHKVSIVPRETVENAAAFLQTLSKILSSMALTAYRSKEMNEKLLDGIKQTSDLVFKVRRMADHTVENVRNMENRFEQMASLAGKCVSEVANCSDIVDVIQDNAMTTHLLGLNASIEASRAKEEGRGFSVIASEVRNLADNSKTSADVIKNKIDNIGDSTQQMQQSAGDAKKLVDECLRDIEDLKNSILELQKNDARNARL